MTDQANSTTQPVLPVSPPSDEKQHRLNALSFALDRATMAVPADYRRVNAYRRALTDVLIDAVQERTLRAISDAEKYLSS